MSHPKINDELMKRVLEKLDKVEDKIDRKFDHVETRLDSMDKTLVKNTENLAEHMRRTDLLETAQTNMSADIEKIKKPFIVAWGIGKIIGFISVLVGIAVGIAKIISGL